MSLSWTGPKTKNDGSKESSFPTMILPSPWSEVRIWVPELVRVWLDAPSMCPWLFNSAYARLSTVSEISCFDFKLFHCGDLSSSPNNSDNLIVAGAGYDASFMKNDQGLMMHLRSLTDCPQIDCWNPPNQEHSSYLTTFAWWHRVSRSAWNRACGDCCC